MSYIKTYEKFKNNKGYMYGRDLLIINNIKTYLGLIINFNMNSNTLPKSKYDIDFIEFFKEILMGKYITFTSVDKLKYNPICDGLVEDVDFYIYKNRFYIRVEILDEWYLIKSDEIVAINNYDADTKPLHKEIKIKKDIEKYNL